MRSVTRLVFNWVVIGICKPVSVLPAEREIGESEMTDYKQRKIELRPKRCDDGTWRCPYRIIEFRATCWGYHQGAPRGIFASRDSAAAAALEEAKQIVDSLEPPSKKAVSGSSAVLGIYVHKLRKRMFSLVRSLDCLWKRVLYGVLILPSWRKLFNSISSFAWSRR